MLSTLIHYYMQFKNFYFLFLGLFLAACQAEPQSAAPTDAPPEEPQMEFQNEGHEWVYKMVQKVGDYSKWAAKKDVRYTYTYALPNGQKDVSTEEYIFDGELSYGKYTQHDRTFPELDGVIEQGYDGQEFWLKLDGEMVSDPELLESVAFKRPTNFYWFVMMPKLLDPGLTYDYLGEKSIEDQNYHVVKVGFDADEPTDIYQVYINAQTLLVDQFLFTVVAYDMVETPLLMQVEYEEIEGLLIPSQRKYKVSTWDAEVSEDPWVQVSWTDIQFNAGLQVSDFKK